MRAEGAGGGTRGRAGEDGDQHGADGVKVERQHGGAHELAQHDVQDQGHGHQHQRGGGQHRQHRGDQQDGAEQESAEGHERREAGRAVGDVRGLGEDQEEVGGRDRGGAGEFQQAAVSLCLGCAGGARSRRRSGGREGQGLL